MTVKLFALVCTLALVIGIGGCPWPLNTVWLDDSNDGDDIEISLSQRLVITLPSNASTGYSWAIAELDTQILENTDQSYIQPLSPLVGAPGHERWEFTARAAGTTSLRLEYRQAGAPEGEDPADTFEIVVTVVASDS